jgi:hypothetical protein
MGYPQQAFTPEWRLVRESGGCRPVASGGAIRRSHRRRAEMLINKKKTHWTLTRKGEQIISDYFAEVDGHPIGLMVFQTSGHLSSLEAYSLPGADEPFDLPPISCILGPA